MELYLRGIQVAYTGMSVTLTITFGAVIIGLIIGLFVALGKMSQRKWIRVVVGVYVEVLRGTPLIVQALIMYYGIPMFLQSRGIDFRWDTPVVGAIVACGINSSAYVGEIVRAGLQAVDKGQMEAARSLGMNGFQAMRHVIIPQAFRIILPALCNEFISLIKETAVLSMITIVDVTRKSMLWVAATFNAWPAYIGLAIVYLSLTIPLSRVVAYMEGRMARSDRGK